jgi:DNA-binding Lrp family transcriptional regulator
VTVEPLTEKLLNDFQHDFPLSPAPFAQIARCLNTSTAVVLARLRELQLQGAVSRVGPVFRPNTIGASTLAALQVPAAKLETVAAVVNVFPEVNHNYEREHRYNLWFVVTAADPAALADTLARIERQTGHPVLSLPLVRDYHIDLGFRMALAGHAPLPESGAATAVAANDTAHETAHAAAEDLIEAIQAGLPLVARPYREIGARLGMTEQAVIERLRGMIDAGIIKRLGVVVRHHELGYRANAMVVWDVPDERVERIGRRLGDIDCVTLCYQRPRRLPDWPFNLFCMVHGQDRDEVLACIGRLVEALGLGDIRHAVLFSGRRFKQRGARYRLGH